MSRRVELLIVGAGPAGMSAAIIARRHGMDVLVVDEQVAPGGQIWRNVEAVSAAPGGGVFGKPYNEGAEVVSRFRASGAKYQPRTQVWQVEPGPKAFVTHGGMATSIEAGCLLLATGAQERPVPFPGWTLPGVMTVGAAQIVLKTSNQVPERPVWIAGCGPLALLYAVQLLKSGGQIAGFLDTMPPGRLSPNISKLAKAALNAPIDLMKGMSWMAALQRRVPYVRHVAEIEAVGSEKLERLRYVTASGKSRVVAASLLLVHEGVVPTIHPTLALGCRHIWNVDQDNFAPELDTWGETSEPHVFVAGDGAGIGGAFAACLRGEIAALGMAAKAGHISDAEAATAVKPIRARLKRALAPRAFLDSLYRPRPAVFMPTDPATIACRCEEIRISTILAQAGTGHVGPNQVKASTRAGMGPCQGRQCSYTVAHVLAAGEGRPVPDVGLYRVRPPIKPLTLDELSTLGAAGAVS